MKTKVYALKTNPKSILNDYQSLFQQHFRYRPREVIIKLNLSWNKFYPACSSPPWQLEGTILGLLNAGFQPKQIIPVENRTVVTNVQKGALNNKWLPILKKYNIKMHYLTLSPYRTYQPKTKMLVLDKVFPKGISLPKIIFNKPLISLATLKMHVFTSITGATKNYFGMLNTRRHYCHRFIHQAITDLLAIQKEIHPWTFNLIDGTIAGIGAGPRDMDWTEKNIILASQDPTAVDAVCAKILGFKPMNVKFISLATQKKLGQGRLSKIDISGAPITPIPSARPKDTFASRGQKFIYHSLPLPVEKLLLQTPIAPWSYLASNIYHNLYWYNVIGRKRLKRFQKTGWARLFNSYSKE